MKGTNPHEGSEVWNPRGASKVLDWLLNTHVRVYAAGQAMKGESPHEDPEDQNPCGMDWPLNTPVRV